MMTDHAAQPGGPRRCRLHIFDGQYEVLHKELHLATLNLDAPDIDLVLSQHLHALTRAALAANEPMDRPRLEVRDATTGVLILNRTGC